MPPNICIPECGAIPPNKYSRMVKLEKSDLFLQQYATTNLEDKWWHLAVGTYEGVGDGGDCFHYKTNAYQLFLHHLDDTLDDILVADTTAGIDNLSTSMSIAYDLCVICVEPTIKSVSVLSSFCSLAADLPIPYLVIANKIECSEDLDFISKYVPENVQILELGLKSEFFEMEKGADVQINPVGIEIDFELILKAAKASQLQSRSQRTRLLREFFEKEVCSYWNAYHGLDLTVLLDNSKSKFDKECQLCE